MRIKQVIKHNQFVYKTLVGIIEFVIKNKNRVKWTFWKKYPFLARKNCNVFSVHLVPVLYFHWFATKDEKENHPKYATSRWYATIEDFEEQIDYLKKSNYHFLTADEYYQWYVGKKRIPRKSVLLTFDDGEQSLIDLVLPVIRRESVPVVFFVIGKRVLEHNEAIPEKASEDLVCFFGQKRFEQLKREPLVTLGSHTYNMHFSVNGTKAVDYLPSQEVNEDFQRMNQALPFDVFAAPYGKYNDTVYENVKRFFKMGFTIETPGCPYSIRGKDVYKINRIRVDALTTMDDLKRILR